MRNAFLLLTLLSTGIGLSAQPSASVKVIRSAANLNCPVDFDAQLNSPIIMRTLQAGERHTDSPYLDLSFGQLMAPTIVGATVTIHGSSPSTQYLPVNDRSSENRTQTFKLEKAPGSKGLEQTEVLVNQMALVGWAEITELDYADGTSWHSTPFTVCRARPSSFHLVN